VLFKLCVDNFYPKLPQTLQNSLRKWN